MSEYQPKNDFDAPNEFTEAKGEQAIVFKEKKVLPSSLPKEFEAGFPDTDIPDAEALARFEGEGGRILETN